MGTVAFVPEPYLQDLLDDTAFERYVLERALPLVAPDTGSTSGRFDVDANQMSLHVMVHETLGMTMDQAVERLGIRPLCFGAAWKIVDLMLERALREAGLQPKHGARWTIAEKVSRARGGAGSANPLSADHDVWVRLLAAYTETEEIRHSLVHRRAQIGAQGEVAGEDRNKQPLRPMTASELEEFCRAAQLAVDALQHGLDGPRGRNRLLWHLDQLANVTGLPAVGAHEPSQTIPRIGVATDGAADVDWPTIKERLRSTFPQAPEIDVLLELPAGTFLVRLEDAPDTAERFEPASPPAWSTAISTA